MIVYWDLMFSPPTPFHFMFPQRVPQEPAVHNGQRYSPKTLMFVIDIGVWYKALTEPDLNDDPTPPEAPSR